MKPCLDGSLQCDRTTPIPGREEWRLYQGLRGVMKALGPKEEDFGRLEVLYANYLAAAGRIYGEGRVV